MTASSGVAKIDVERERGVTLVFDDGFECFFANDDLRAACPCATCRGIRDRGDEVWPTPGAATPARIDDAQLVGAWGLGILWSDGHSTGIFPFESLRSWAASAGEE